MLKTSTRPSLDSVYEGAESIHLDLSVFVLNQEKKQEPTFSDPLVPAKKSKK